MSLQLAAQHMASRGRGPDTQLVHMAPQEVAGLHALAKAHGGSLTTNPDTGLPEAGFLSSILPTLVGVGLSVASGGALTPLMAAGITGAGYGIATGSLQKGLMAGLGAYGGAGLAGGLMGAGTGALSSAAGSTAANAVAPTLATEAVAPTLIEGAGAASANLSAAPAYDVMTGGFNSFDPGLGANAVSPINAGQMASQAVPTVTQAPVLSQSAADIGNVYAQEQAAQNAVANRLATATPMETAKAGIGAISNDPMRFMNKQNLQYGLAAAAPVMFQEPEPMAPRPTDKPYEYSFDYGRVEDPQAGYTGAATGQRTYFNPTFTRMAAGGGLMDLGPVQAMSDRNEAQTLMANGGQMFAEGGIAYMAQGGQSHLGDYSDGGRLLKGPGDGVSDDIPASIGDKRPARLADGEFVVSADVVSGLGNGSTEAGARKLYAMMDRVRKARTGTKKMGKTVNPDKLIPV